MASRSQNVLSFVLIILLWRFCRTKAYVDVCESPPTNVYCNCDVPSYRDNFAYNKVSCILFQDVKVTDPVWRSLGDSEGISYLKLQPRLPVILDYIPSELKHMPNLKILKIQEGNLGSLKSYTLSEYPALEELDLEGNEITALESNFVAMMPKLRKLTLSRNNLSELLADSLNVMELEILFLDRNKISRIEPCAFCSLHNLKELELWGNQISDLTEYTFRGLKYLRKLDLFKNEITLLNDKVFHQMERLHELDLKENKISYIASRAFYGLERLQILSLGSNLIKTLHDEVFTPIPNLMSLDLHNNEIEFLQKAVVDNIKKVKTVNFNFIITGNPYKCNCAMNWIPEYRSTALNKRFKNTLDRLDCAIDNQTVVLVTEYIKENDCSKASMTKPGVSPASITSKVTKSTDDVLKEINDKEDKIFTTASTVNEGTEEAYLRDIVSDRTVNDDSQPGSARMNYHSVFLTCVALLTINLFGHLKM